MLRVCSTSLERMQPDVIVSIASPPPSWRLAAVRSRRCPCVGMLHQPPGGIDDGPLRTSSRPASIGWPTGACADCWWPATRSPTSQARRRPAERHQGRAAWPRRRCSRSAPPPGDLRQGRRAAFLCVGNWVERKGIFESARGVLRRSSSTRRRCTWSATPAPSLPTRGVCASGSRARRLLGRVVVHGPVRLRPGRRAVRRGRRVRAAELEGAVRHGLRRSHGVSVCPSWAGAPATCRILPTTAAKACWSNPATSPRLTGRPAPAGERPRPAAASRRRGEGQGSPQPPNVGRRRRPVLGSTA